MPPATLVRALTSSTEYLAQVVQHEYQTLLGRPADPQSLSGAVSLLNLFGLFIPGPTNGLDLLRSMLISSPEYFQRHGGTNAGFLAATYHDLFGRDIDPFAASVLGGQLASGVSRSAIVASLLSSLEAKQALVRDDYSRILNRPVDAAGLDFQANALLRGASELDLIAALLSSQEFLQQV
jgi:hypothetical protein